MRKLHKHYINGQFVEGSGSDLRPIVNPATGVQSGEMLLGTSADVDAAVSAARAAFDSFSQTSREERLALLNAIVAEYSKRMGEMAEVIREEMGAPKMLAERAHAPSGLGHCMTAAKVLQSFEFDEQQGNHTITKEPIGVVGMITPWNWPINQITCKVAPAIATGCTMVLKPSEVAPYSAQLFAEIIDAAGVPAGVFNMVYGEGPVVGEAMSAHPGIDMMSLTGSGRAGAAVQRAAATTIKRVALELGGKSANILLDDVDFETVVARDTIAVMRNSGQTCTALTRMLVPAARMDEAAAIAKAAAEGFAVGNPAEESSMMGPIAHQAQFEKVRAMIQKGIDEGATLVTGGLDQPDGVPSDGFYVRPTVFANVTPDMTIAREEIFGPVLSIMGYQDEDDAVRIANDTPYGLSGAVSSADPSKAQAIARRLRTGMVHINGAPIDLNLPFGGYKQSGLGREWGEHAFNDYLEIKSMVGYSAA